MFSCYIFIQIEKVYTMLEQLCLLFTKKEKEKKNDGKITTNKEI